MTMMLDEEAVADLLEMDETIEAVQRGLVELSLGHVIQPVRSIVPVAEHAGFLGLMPAYAGALGVKLVTVYPRNTDVPTHLATIMLFKPETGEPLAIMDGRLITEVRTAAASAVATRTLARPDASVLAILGSGVQAGSHLEALRRVRPIKEVRVWSPRHAREFAEAHGVEAASSAQEAVMGADIVVTVTSSTTPVLHGEWLGPGVHVNAVGACRPDWRELDDDALERALIFVDSRDAALTESGDVIAAGHIDGEIGEVCAGRVTGRTAPEEITIFKSLGVAVEDVVTANLVYEKALSKRDDRG